MMNVFNSEGLKKRHIYRGRRIQWNDVNRLWWFRIVDEEGRLEPRCRGSLKEAMKQIDLNLEEI